MLYDIDWPACKRKPLQHFFDIRPAPDNGASAALVADPHFRHQVELLCAKGPRLPAELLAEVAIEYDLEDAIRKKIARYLSIPNAALDVTGARDFPPLPMYGVSR